jgi:hypothetical protein
VTVPPHRRRIWLAAAPAGTWSTGDAVISDFGDVTATLALYEKMGWKITGPYVLER